MPAPKHFKFLKTCTHNNKEKCILDNLHLIKLRLTNKHQQADTADTWFDNSRIVQNENEGVI